MDWQAPVTCSLSTKVTSEGEGKGDLMTWDYAGYVGKASAMPYKEKHKTSKNRIGGSV